MQIQADRSRNEKYLSVDYEKVDSIVRKIRDYISNTDRPELVVLLRKFKNKERVLEDILKNRFILKKHYKLI